MKAIINRRMLAALAACLALAACAEGPVVEYPLSMHQTWHERTNATATADVRDLRFLHTP